MGNVTSVGEYRQVMPQPGITQVHIHFTEADGVDNADTFTLTLANYGAARVVGFLGFIHTTENSVIVQEQPTSAVSGGVATFTVGGATGNKARDYLIWLSAL